MRIKELPPTQFSPEKWNPETRKRSKGLHLTEIIHALLEEQGKSRKRTDLSEQDLAAYQSMGFLWERILEKALASMEDGQDDIVRPGEIKMDDIYMTPDAIRVDPEVGLALEEWKCTWKSSNHPIDTYEHWLMQIKSYCLALNTRIAFLRVFHVNGTWNPPVPQVRQYLLEFTDEELALNWIAILNQAQKMKEERKNAGEEI